MCNVGLLLFCLFVLSLLPTAHFFNWHLEIKDLRWILKVITIFPRSLRLSLSTVVMRNKGLPPLGWLYVRFLLLCCLTFKHHIDFHHSYAANTLLFLPKKERNHWQPCLLLLYRKFCVVDKFCGELIFCHQMGYLWKWASSSKIPVQISYCIFVVESLLLFLVENLQNFEKSVWQLKVQNFNFFLGSSIAHLKPKLLRFEVHSIFVEVSAVPWISQGSFCPIWFTFTVMELSRNLYQVDKVNCANSAFSS